MINLFLKLKSIFKILILNLLGHKIQTQRSTFRKYQLEAKPKLHFSARTSSAFLTVPGNKRSLAAADLEATPSLNI